MTRSNSDVSPMNPDDLEQQLQRRPLRPVPPQCREEILAAALSAQPPAQATRPGSRFISSFLELLWPAPRAWAALAALWLLLLLVNVRSSGPSQPMARNITIPSSELLLAIQRQSLPLLDAPSAPPAETPQPTPPSPRSQRPGSNPFRTAVFQYQR